MYSIQHSIEKSMKSLLPATRMTGTSKSQLATVQAGASCNKVGEIINLLTPVCCNAVGYHSVVRQ